MAGTRGAGCANSVCWLLAHSMVRYLVATVSINAEPDEVTNTGQFVLALDLAASSRSISSMGHRHIGELRNTKSLPSVGSVAGEQRAQRADRLRNGIPLAPELLTQPQTRVSW